MRELNMKKLSLSLLIIFLSSCSSASENSVQYEESYFGAATADMVQESKAISSEYNLSQGDYIIRTGYASTDVSSAKFQSVINEVESLVKLYQGYISNTYLSTNYQGLKSYSITSNIPSDKFDDFINDVESISEFTNINLNANDVTTYVLDIDSRLNSLYEEKIALESIREEATSTADKLQVQSQLRYINQDIEMLEAQREYYEKATSYSTLSLEIREGSGVSLFSWNYYLQRALSWVEEIVGITVSVSIILIPLMIIFFLIKKFRSKK
jgi:hypothetical protein